MHGSIRFGFVVVLFFGIGCEGSDRENPNPNDDSNDSAGQICLDSTVENCAFGDGGALLPEDSESEGDGAALEDGGESDTKITVAEHDASDTLQQDGTAGDAEDPLDGEGGESAVPEEDTESEGDATPESDAVVESDTTPEPDVEEESDTTPEPDVEEEGDATPEPDAEEEGDTTPEPDAEEEGDTTPEPDAEEPVVTGCEEDCPEGMVCSNGTCGTAVCGLEGFDGVVMDNGVLLASELLVSQQPDLTWAPSKIYTWADLMQGLATSCNPGFAGFSFWTGDADSGSDNQDKVALINLAAFLAQSMKETIRYDACDENNWDDTNGYKISNSCGQLGQNYEDYDCEMACPKGPTLQMTAVTNATWYGAPGPMFCAPDSVLIEAGLSTNGSTGYWNYATDCWPYPATEEGFIPLSIDAWLRPSCEVYAGQKGGQWVWDGSGGSVEGCCWWGRGVIQTTGRCNFGTLNHYLGQSHLNSADFPLPDSVPYPEVDFCANPNVICESTEHPELKWIAGLFYWMSSVQEYDVEGWDYEAELQAYIDGGLSGYAFIDAVSGIVNRGCHNPPCASGPVDGLEDRRANFTKALTAMGLL